MVSGLVSRRQRGLPRVERELGDVVVVLFVDIERAAADGLARLLK